MRDNTESSPSLVELRYRSRANQSTLNIELGIAGKQTVSNNASASVSSGGVSGATGGGSIIGNTGGGGGLLPCFTGETEVGIGFNQRIDRLKIGDETEGFNSQKNKVELCEIKHIFRHETSILLRITLENDYGDARTIYTTPEHKFYSDGEYVPIDSFNIGDNLKNAILDEVDDQILVEKTLITLAEPITVYNIETTLGNYFANGVLVSNRKDEDGGAPTV